MEGSTRKKLLAFGRKTEHAASQRGCNEGHSFYIIRGLAALATEACKEPRGRSVVEVEGEYGAQFQTKKGRHSESLGKQGQGFSSI